MEPLRVRRNITILGLLAGLAAGCGQEDPAPPSTELEPYHPLVVGSWWRYAHSDWTEQVDLGATSIEGQPAFTMVDSFNPDDRLKSDSVIASVDGRVVRLTKEEFLVGTDNSELLTSSVTYGVGFTRFNEDWANQPVGYKETPEYVRVETQPGDAGPRPPEQRRHTFEIVSLSEEVRTGIGSFDCIVIRRTKDWQAEEDGVDLSDAQTKTFWFARGVGKVQEKNEESGNIELLLDYSIPEAGG
jgi:hypothetical protein